jgi:hypothetical protein
MQNAQSILDNPLPFLMEIRNWNIMDRKFAPPPCYVPRIPWDKFWHYKANPLLTCSAKLLFFARCRYWKKVCKSNTRIGQKAVMIGYQYPGTRDGNSLDTAHSCDSNVIRFYLWGKQFNISNRFLKMYHKFDVHRFVHRNISYSKTNQMHQFLKLFIFA